MKPVLSLTLIGCLAASALPVVAQPLQSFKDLALRVNLDDRLRVEDQSGVKTTGRLTRLTRDDITIQTDAGEKHSTSEQVRNVALRAHSLGKSALIGAGVFAVLGEVAVARNGNAGAAPVGAAVLGAGAGLAIGALIPHMKTIYRAAEHGASVPLSRDPIGARTSLLEDLALRVNLDDQLRVEDQSGGRTTGRLTGLTADEIMVQTAAGETHFTRETIRQVAVRRQPIRAAVLIGAGAGAALGAAIACTGAEREECVDGPIMVGALGAGLGLAVGALIHRTTIVYPEPEKRTVVSPAISRNAVGVRISRRW
ncbi:MAG: hypothetical protein HY048_07510 [Acidobacteria bacterium]|nr:hypothetical protein [Acidobacteriota bacterium]